MRPKRDNILPILILNFVLFTPLSASAGTLYGGVTHADYLAPPPEVEVMPQQNLPPQQAVGLPAAVNPTVGLTAGRATLQNPVIEWFPIPKWMAGKWGKKGDLTTIVTDLRSGISTPVNEYIEDYMSVTWGYQQDSQGNVWHANLIPSERDGFSQGKNVSFTIVNLKVVEATPQNLATRTHYVVKETMGRQVTDLFQQESLTHYELAGGPQKMDAISSNRVFTYAGQPKRDGKMVSHYMKESEFEPISTKQGIDLSASLNDYLRSHNMAGFAK